MGYDFVIIQGTEAGGHTGDVSLFPLLPQVLDAVGDKVPVVAAGGIFDGRGVAAALAMGADGVWVGTRFLMTPEAVTCPGFKEKLLTTTSRDTVITMAYTGKPCRVIKNEYAVLVLSGRARSGRRARPRTARSCRTGRRCGGGGGVARPRSFTAHVQKSGIPEKEYYTKMPREEMLKINHLYKPERPGVDVNVCGSAHARMHSRCRTPSETRMRRLCGVCRARGLLCDRWSSCPAARSSVRSARLSRRTRSSTPCCWEPASSWTGRTAHACNRAPPPLPIFPIFPIPTAFAA